MTAAKSRGSYKDCEDYFERAIEAPRGIAVTFEDKARATAFTHRMNTYRSLCRRDTKVIYPADDPRHGTSMYDPLVISRDPNNPARVLIQRREVTPAKVEEL